VGAGVEEVDADTKAMAVMLALPVVPAMPTVPAVPEAAVVMTMART
jgi:hypothetical protein